MNLTCTVSHNTFEQITRGQFNAAVSRGVRKQASVSEGNVKANIVKYDAIDTGNMLNSVAAKMTGQTSAEVTVSAESAEGYPYPAAVNYGTIHMDGRPFFTEEELQAAREFPGRVKRELESL